MGHAQYLYNYSSYWWIILFLSLHTVWIFIFIHQSDSENNAILGYITNKADVRQSIPTEHGIHKTDQWGMGPGECQAIWTWSRTQYVTDCAAELSWNCNLFSADWYFFFSLFHC